MAIENIDKFNLDELNYICRMWKESTSRHFQKHKTISDAQHQAMKKGVVQAYELMVVRRGWHPDTSKSRYLWDVLSHITPEFCDKTFKQHAAQIRIV